MRPMLSRPRDAATRRWTRRSRAELVPHRDRLPRGHVDRRGEGHVVAVAHDDLMLALCQGELGDGSAGLAAPISAVAAVVEGALVDVVARAGTGVASLVAVAVALVPDAPSRSTGVAGEAAVVACAAAARATTPGVVALSATVE